MYKLLSTLNLDLDFSVCHPIDNSEDPLSSPYKVAMAWYWMYLTRISTLLDTMILIGRKKFHKVTNYHIIVHCYSMLHYWTHTRYAAGGHGTLDIMIGATTVVEMHLFYFWISMAPSEHPWFKQHLTTFQLVQQSVNLMRLVAVLIVAPTCDFPWQISCLSFIFLLFCFWFFISSYLKLYVRLDKC